MTKLNAALPKGEANGLVVIQQALLMCPEDVHVVIALVDCKATTTNHDTGDVVPTARIRRIEVVQQGDLRTAQTLMRRALEERTGKVVLPFDLEEDLRAAFRVDPQTGEILGDGGGSDG